MNDRKRFQTDNLMYAYMAGLAIIDIAYLICTSIRCHYNVVKGNFKYANTFWKTIQTMKH